MDLSKAYDSVQFDVLKVKLETCGINKKKFNLPIYLIGRK